MEMELWKKKGDAVKEMRVCVKLPTHRGKGHRWVNLSNCLLSKDRIC